MNFQDLQQGFQQWNAGATDNTLRNGLLLIVALVAVVVLVMHLRQRWQKSLTPDSERKLARELARIVPFPFATRLLLHWVARSTATPFAALLISPELFAISLDRWASEPTFTLVRRWGRVRLTRLQHLLITTE